jgi:hypothetical protein
MNLLRLGLLALLPLIGQGQTVIQNTTYASGQILTIAGSATVDASTGVTVSNGANITYRASSKVRLGPGFTETTGSHFHAEISAAGGGSEQAPTITSSTFASGTVGVAFSYQITATNSPINYGAAGLPAGLNFDAAAGLISGAPTTEGTGTIALSATNLAGTGSALLTLSINSEGQSQLVTITPSSQVILLGQSVMFTASGGQNGYVWGGSASGAGSTQTVTFTTGGSHTVTVYSPAGTGYAQSNVAFATVTVKSGNPEQNDANNQTQLNIHIPLP